MKALLWLLGLLGLLCGQSAALLRAGVIFPLYIYPGDGCTGWAAVTSSITNFSTLPFYIVVNPASGPGAPNSQPDVNYQACIANLRATGQVNNNVKVLGYVATGYGNKDSTAVTTDIHTYNQWLPAYRPDGIFFDEVGATASLLTKYQSYASTVHSDFGTSYIVLNPGVNPETTSYYSIADQIVTFEGFYRDFKTANVATGSSTPIQKQSIIIHDAPSQLPSTLVNDLAKTLGVGSSFITDFPNAGAYSNVPTQWTTFLQTLVAVQFDKGKHSHY